MFQEVPSLDQRLTELQSQLDRLSASLQLWREQQDHLTPSEERMADLSRQCDEIVTQWTRTGERQARAVNQLEERVSAFSAVEERLHHDAASRLTALERMIEEEWAGLRRLHEAPARALQEQAIRLAQVSIAASNSSAGGFERAEARLADIEAAIHSRLGGVSQQIERAVADFRALVPARPPEAAPQQSWPIEGVVRLHNQLRESAESPSTPTGSPAPQILTAPLALPSAPPELTARLDSVERAMAEGQADLAAAVGRQRRAGWWMQAGTAGAVAAVIALAIAASALQREARDASARAVRAEQEAQSAVVTAGEQLAAAREQAARDLAAARTDAARAQRVADVLAAPDLVRYNVSGSGPAAISGQVLWSRTRGVVFGAVRVAPLPPGMTYQLWLLTEALPVTAGTFAPDSGGRVTFTADPPLPIGPVAGAAVTVEPAGGSRTPSERLLVQNRAARPAPVADGSQTP